MCQQGDTTTLFAIPQPNDKMKDIVVDSCLAELVATLNNAGFHTIACCCGHGVRPGSIALHDGREFIIAPNYESARITEKAFPPLNPPIDFEEDNLSEANYTE